MTDAERRQMAALLRRAARMAELLDVWSIWDCIHLAAQTINVRDLALREWHRALPRRKEVGMELRILLALLLAAAIEAGDLP